MSPESVSFLVNFVSFLREFSTSRPALENESGASPCKKYSLLMYCSPNYVHAGDSKLSRLALRAPAVPGFFPGRRHDVVVGENLSREFGEDLLENISSCCQSVNGDLSPLHVRTMSNSSVAGFLAEEKVPILTCVDQREKLMHLPFMERACLGHGRKDYKMKSFGFTPRMTPSVTICDTTTRSRHKVSTKNNIDELEFFVFGARAGTLLVSKNVHGGTMDILVERYRTSAFLHPNVVIVALSQFLLSQCSSDSRVKKIRIDVGKTPIPRCAREGRGIGHPSKSYPSAQRSAGGIQVFLSRFSGYLNEEDTLHRLISEDMVAKAPYRWLSVSGADDFAFGNFIHDIGRS